MKMFFRVLGFPVRAALGLIAVTLMVLIGLCVSDAIEDIPPIVRWVWYCD